MKHKIIVAGIGPGNPDYMVPMARQTIASAMALVGGRRALAQFAQPAGTGQQTMAVTRDIPAVLDFIRTELAKHDVVAMVSGDPGLLFAARCDPAVFSGGADPGHTRHQRHAVGLRQTGPALA
jgi:precorrin-6B methylase 1